MLALHPPVEAPVVRPFTYERATAFAGGRHRGVDFGAPIGTPALAPCSGTVAFAGPTPSGRAVVVRCARHRVTLVPVEAVRVRRGDAVGPGVPVARVGRGAHPGLHLSVRRAGDRFGYVDPGPLLRATGDRPPPLPLRGPRPSRPPRVQDDRPARPVPTAPDPAPRTSTAPWPAFGGAAVALLAVAGVGPVRRGRRRAGGEPRRQVDMSGAEA